jgi:hypothetical protein
MKVQPEEYAKMREWFALVSQKAFPPQLMEEAQPTAVLDKLAERSPVKAREGLAVGIGDLIQITNSWSVQDVEAMDAALSEEQLPTLTEMRVRFSKVVGRVVRRGRIISEAEYHAVRNAAELTEASDGPLWKLLADYESAVR